MVNGSLRAMEITTNRFQKGYNASTGAKPFRQSLIFTPIKSGGGKFL
jgi:hypothetical protein